MSPHNQATPPSSLAASARQESELSKLPVSDHLRNLANRVIIESQHHDILQEIRANPTKDEPRIRYADHLTRTACSTGDTLRAELIRLQVARGTDHPTAREREILTAHEREWARELGHVRAIEWDRGFVRGVTMSPRHFAQGGERLAREPISHLRIHLPGGSEEGGADLHAAFHARHFQQIEKLTFWISSASTIEQIENLLGAPTPNLREIYCERFTDSAQTLLDRCHSVRWNEDNARFGPEALQVGHIAITFGHRA